MYAVQSVTDSSVRGIYTDIGGVASKDKKSAAVMVWNYHDDDLKGNAAFVEVTVNGLPAKTIMLTHYRIDEEHSNSYEVWKKMGSPQNPTKEQIALLEKGGQLQTIGKPERLTATNGRVSVNISLPRQGVSLLKMDW